MRTIARLAPLLHLLACTPETDLRQIQAEVPTTEAAAGPLSSPEPDPLAGQLVEPPSGSTGIAANLLALIVRFTEAVQPASAAAPFVLRTSAGGGIPLDLGLPAPCARVCYQMPLPVELEPSSLYTLEVIAGELRFLDGKPVPAGSAGTFTTADGADRFAPRIETIGVTASEGCVAVQLTADEVVRAEVTVTDGVQTVTLPASGFASDLAVTQRLPVPPPGPRAEVVVRVYDRSGNVGQSEPLPVTLPSSLPRLAITELLPNPAGSETTQEFVEVQNLGSEPVALGGLVIADKTGSDVLPDVTLPPGGFAVIVAEKYDPEEGSDVAPAATAILVRVPGRIGSDGLANAGETVQLRTATGDVISQYGTWVDTSASAWSGKSLKRSSPDACDGPEAWSPSPSPATPGS